MKPVMKIVIYAVLVACSVWLFASWVALRPLNIFEEGELGGFLRYLMGIAFVVTVSIGCLVRSFR